MLEKMQNQNLASLDFSKLQPLHQKRTLAFVNHFVTTNVQFLNNFMKKCEQRLMQFERKLEKVNAAMVLLETRLSSIPEISIATPKKEEITPTSEGTDSIDSKITVDIHKAHDKEAESAVQDEVQELHVKVSRPEYDRFVKMVQVGVPVQAVKLKLSLEGLDPNVLDEILQK